MAASRTKRKGQVKDEHRSPSQQRTFVFLSVFGVLIAIGAYLLKDLALPPVRFDLGNLTVVERLDKFPSLEKIGEFSERPFVISTKQTPASNWEALDSWSALALSTWKIVWTGAHTSTKPRISYFNRRRRLFNYLVQHDWPLPYADEDVPSPELFSRCRKNNTFHYVAGGLSGQLLDDVQPFQGMVVPTLASLRGEQVGSADVPNPGFFISCKGVIVPAHYDEGSNFFTQIDGDKTVILFPPQLASNLYTYPTTHPQYRQSQIPDIHNVDPKEFPEFKHVRNQGMVAKLKAGDTLYIPPWYLHYIVADTDSVSISIMTDSSTRDAFAAGYSVVSTWRSMGKPWNAPIAEDKVQSFEMQSILFQAKLETFEMLACGLLLLEHEGTNSDIEMQKYLETRWKWVHKYTTETINFPSVLGCCKVEPNFGTSQERLEQMSSSTSDESVQQLSQYLLELDLQLKAKIVDLRSVFSDSNVHRRVRSIFIHRYIDELLEGLFSDNGMFVFAASSLAKACVN